MTRIVKHYTCIPCMHWLHYSLLSCIGKQQSIVPIVLHVFGLTRVRSVSRSNYGRKVAQHSPRLSHIIEFTRRHCTYVWNNDPSPVRSTDGLGSSVDAGPLLLWNGVVIWVIEQRLACTNLHRNWGAYGFRRLNGYNGLYVGYVQEIALLKWHTHAVYKPHKIESVDKISAQHFATTFQENTHFICN